MKTKAFRKTRRKEPSNPLAQGFAGGRISSDERQQKEGDAIGGEATEVAKRRQEVLLAEFCLVGASSFERHSSERFQGRNGLMS